MQRRDTLLGAVLVAAIASFFLFARRGEPQPKTTSATNATSSTITSASATNTDPLDVFRLDGPPFDFAQPTPKMMRRPDGYVGSEVCARCHRDEAAKVAARPMGHSGLHRITARTAALDALFDGRRVVRHEASGFSYRPIHDEHGYFVEERLDAEDGRPLHVRREPVTITFTAAAIGTGFGFERGGRFYQVPIDWYPTAGTWALDPGYVQNGRFSRVFGASCLGCHGEPSEHVDGNEGIVLGAPSEGIGCERCHGPGGKHAESTRAEDIVDPARLSLAGQLDVCARCHLEGTAEVKGVHWVETTPRPDSFTLVSAADRLVRSACFVKSAGKLGCTSCHDAHASDHDAGGAEHQRAACLGCHAKDAPNATSAGKACTASTAERAARADACPSCHMATDTPSDFRAEVPGVRLDVTDHWIRKRPQVPRPIGAKTVDAPIAAIAPWAKIALPPSATSIDVTPLDEAIATAWTNGLENRSIPLLVAAANEAPSSPELYRLLGDVYAARLDALALGGDDEVRRSLARRRLLARAEEAKLAPDDVAVLVRWAEAGLDVGDAPALRDAELAYRRALAIFPDEATALLELGAMLYRAGRTSESMPLLARAVEVGTDALEAHVILGVEARKKGDLAAAVIHFARARDCAPRDRFVLEQLEWLYEARKQAAESADVARTLAVVPPDERPFARRRSTRFLP